MMILLTDKAIKELCVKHLAWDEPVSNKDLELVKPLLKAQLKKVVEYLDTLTFYDDWGGESGKKTVDMIQQAILKEL